MYGMQRLHQEGRKGTGAHTPPHLVHLQALLQETQEELTAAREAAEAKQTEDDDLAKAIAASLRDIAESYDSDDFE